MLIFDDGEGGLIATWTPRRWPRPTWRQFNWAALYALAVLAGVIVAEALP